MLVPDIPMFRNYGFEYFCVTKKLLLDSSNHTVSSTYRANSPNHTASCTCTVDCSNHTLLYAYNGFIKSYSDCFTHSKTVNSSK